MRNRVLMPLIGLLFAFGVLLGHELTLPSTVKAGSQERFERLYYQGDDVPPGMDFQVYHDKAAGQEFICSTSGGHYDSARCWPTGRVWK